MVSMAQVARAAGVSPATVSRVLSGSSYPVRPQTREMVLAAARDLGFRPNMLARGLVTSRTSIIAVIVHDIADPYFGEIVRGLEDVAATHHYQVLVSSSDRDPRREIEILELMLSYNVDAVVFAGGSLEDDSYESQSQRLLDAFHAQGRAVVQLAPHRARAVRVMIDNEAAAAAMTAHLVELGHRRIGFVGGPAHLSTAKVRAAGYRRALEEAGIGYDESLVACGAFTSEGGRKAAGQLLDRRPDLTAIFAANDLMAFGVLGGLGARGLAVPAAVSVAGFDDVQAAQYVWPPLTTVAVPMRRLGQVGCEVALAILDQQPVRSVRLPSSLVIRGSTGPCVSRRT
jgi:LacI family transcriptional regulator, galactose operon repressor